jgi:hypothetical protein
MDPELKVALEQLGSVRAELRNTQESVRHLDQALTSKYVEGREAGWWQACRFVCSRLRAMASRPENVLAMSVLVAAANEFEREGYRP